MGENICSCITDNELRKLLRKGPTPKRKMGEACEQSAHQKVKIQRLLNRQKEIQDFPSGPVVKNLPANAGDLGLIPGLGRYHVPRGN